MQYCIKTILFTLALFASIATKGMGKKLPDKQFSCTQLNLINNTGNIAFLFIKGNNKFFLQPKGTRKFEATDGNATISVLYNREFIKCVLKSPDHDGNAEETQTISQLFGLPPSQRLLMRRKLKIFQLCSSEARNPPEYEPVALAKR